MTDKEFLLTDGDKTLANKISLALDDALTIIRRYLYKYESGNLYPARYDGKFYTPVPNGDKKNDAWCDAFYTGVYWLCYEVTKDVRFKEIASKNVLDFKKRMDDNLWIDWHHDTGFLYIPSCVAAYKITKNEIARKTAMEAAYSLSRRFRTRGEFIQSMSTEIDEENYRFIIDTMMNIPLLFWMSEVSGDERYREKAIKHAETTRKLIVREDGSTFHHYLMDFEKAGPKRGLTLQGLSDDSCWSRGQSWMIYGSALMYSATKDESWIDTFEKVTDYFIAHLASDFVPHWDFDVLGTDDDDRDSSAGVIAACGIMEMANNIDPDSGKMSAYLEAAKKLIEAAIDICAVKPDEEREGLLDKCIGSKPHGGKETCCNFGDYFYMEALVRATTNWKKYW